MRLINLTKPLCLLLWVQFSLVALAVNPQALEPLADRHFQPSEPPMLPHAVVSVVHQGETRLLKAYGLEDPSGIRATSAEQTLFRIGSTSKLFTWLAIMQLAEAELLDLDADVQTYLDFELNQKLVAGARDLEPGTITLAHLMTHTAGFEDYPDTLFRLNPDQHLPLSDYVRQHQPQRIYPAGQITAYSNYGSALAGYIVEHLSGLAFEDYVRQNIFQPLGMTQSTFEQPVPLAFQVNLAVPARRYQDEWLTGQFEYMPVSAGAMSTTAADMALFMLAMLEPERLEAAGVLRQATLMTMRERQFSQDDALGGVAHGWMEADVNGERVLFHGGGTLVFDTGLYLLPERNSGVFVSYSGGNFLNHAQFFQAFMDAFYPDLADDTALPDARTGAAERAQALVGEYHQNRRSLTSSEKLVSLMMGPLLIEADAQGDLRVHHSGQVSTFREIAPGRYTNLDGDRFRDYFGTFGRLVFSTDPQGRTLLAAGGPMTYSKAPWFETLAFNAVGIGFVTLFMSLSLVVFAVQGLRRLARKQPMEPTQRRLRWLTIAFAMGWLLLLISTLTTGQPSPLYQLPVAAYDPKAWFDHLIWIPRLLIGIGVVWLLSHILLAQKAFLTRAQWFYVSLFGLQVIGVLAWLWHWNLV
ncbi:MAG: beta-lactamase family protein [Saccharospirillum sp.]|nr:beta-lactamase family protein [Saccharospirillum sp.]